MSESAITMIHRKPRKLILLAARMLLLTGTLSAICGGTEIALRLVGARPRTATALNAFFDRDSQAGWRGRPNAACRFATADFDTYVRHGNDGFREVPSGCTASVAGTNATESPTGEIQQASFIRPASALQEIVSPECVWFVGDSMTWGWGVPNGATFVDLLAAGDPARIYRNLSAPGYSALQEQLLIAKLLETETKPQAVVVVFTNNDLHENFFGSDKDPRRPHFVLNGGSLQLVDFPVPIVDRTSPHTWFKQHSIAYNLLHFHLLNARTAFRNLRTRGKWDAPPAVSPYHWQGLRKVYGDMKTVCDSRGVRLAIAFIPGPCEVTQTQQWNWPEYQSTVHEGLAKLTRELGLPLLDTTDVFRNHFAKPNAEPMTFKTDPHLNETGHRLVAESLASRMRDLR